MKYQQFLITIENADVTKTSTIRQVAIDLIATFEPEKYQSIALSTQDDSDFREIYLKLSNLVLQNVADGKLQHLLDDLHLYLLNLYEPLHVKCNLAELATEINQQCANL